MQIIVFVAENVIVVVVMFIVIVVKNVLIKSRSFSEMLLQHFVE